MLAKIAMLEFGAIRTHALLDLMEYLLVLKEWSFLGCSLWSPLKITTSVLNTIWYLSGSQWSVMSAVMRSYFLRLKTSLVAVTHLVGLWWESQVAHWWNCCSSQSGLWWMWLIMHAASWVHFQSLAQSKFRLCSANHRAGYFSNLACDWLSIVWAYSKQETVNGPGKGSVRFSWCYGESSTVANSLVIVQGSTTPWSGRLTPVVNKMIPDEVSPVWNHFPPRVTGIDLLE